MAEETAQLIIGGESYTLPVRRGTLGPSVVDVSKLYASAKTLTFDPGFVSTASCESKVTYVDGEAGALLYRGYPIEQLADRGDFVEVCHLLLHGELPTPSERVAFEAELSRHMVVHEKMLELFQGFRRDAHPMAVMVGTVGALSAFYAGGLDNSDPEQRLAAAVQLLAKAPTLAAMAYKYTVGQPFVYPKQHLGFAPNFLRMCFSVPAEDYAVDPVIARALDRTWIVHADHAQSTCTSTVRFAASSGATPFACIASGITSLWGPAHGGANEAALAMLREIGTPERIPLYIQRAKDKDDPIRTLGFGHRVYKTFDPRAEIMKAICREVLEAVGRPDDPVFQTALELERAALEDEYFIERELYPNVDFYSGIALDAMGFPPTMFTVLFAVARMAGWIAHLKEMSEASAHRIHRPRQIYTGSPRRDYTEPAQRG